MINLWDYHIWIITWHYFNFIFRGHVLGLSVAVRTFHIGFPTQVAVCGFHIGSRTRATFQVVVRPFHIGSPTQVAVCAFHIRA
jgi:hypothetical protein